jgi:hypothetical protein
VVFPNNMANRRRHLRASGTKRSGAHNAHSVPRHRMRKDDCRGVMRERLLHDFPRVHARAVYRAAEQLFEGNQTVPVVQMQTAENFVGAVRSWVVRKARVISGAVNTEPMHMASR